MSGSSPIPPNSSRVPQSRRGGRDQRACTPGNTPGIGAGGTIPPGTSPSVDAMEIACRPEQPKVRPSHALTVRSLGPKQGALVLSTAADFARLARQDDVPGAAGAQEMKFLITGVDTADPTLYFVNSKSFNYHYEFFVEGLGVRHVSLEAFNAQTYFTDQRKNLAGTLIHHPNFKSAGTKGLYTMELWPSDVAPVNLLTKAFDLLKRGMPFITPASHIGLAYHPVGDAQERALDSIRVPSLKTINTDDLYGNVTYAALNMGKTYGRLVYVPKESVGKYIPRPTDIPIFETPPNELSRVAAVISETPQTPLSHLNVLAKQNAMPNAYLKDASTDAAVRPLLGKTVSLEVTGDGLELKAATEAQVRDFWDSLRPTGVMHPPSNLAVKNVTNLDAIGHRDASAFGSKAANVGELRKILPANTPEFGFGIPIAIYHQFMEETSLSADFSRMKRDLDRADTDERARLLEAFRKKIERATVPASLATQINAIQSKFRSHYGRDVSIRCRSSSNNEDLPGFNGAGLYDSFAHRPDEGELTKTVKQVWASLWNLRAYEEREFHRVPHEEAAMGVLVHRSFDDEQANGVAVTKNIYDPNWKGFYVNAQLGESLVTNPDPKAVPDEVLISRIGANNEWVTQYIRHTSEALPRNQKTVLDAKQLEQLRGAMDTIQTHFKRLYRRQNDDKFAMDIEFKFDAAGKLVVKQARPWLD